MNYSRSCTAVGRSLRLVVALWKISWNAATMSNIVIGSGGSLGQQFRHCGSLQSPLWRLKKQRSQKPLIPNDLSRTFGVFAL
jgi:hypothetical protein